MKKPRIFIASAAEGLSIAYHLQALLDHDAECTVWNQSVFHASSVTLTDLVAQAKNNEYGIFVFSFDDVLTIRNTEKRSVRDNVIFELGLFIGTIGAMNCFIVMPPEDDSFHLPTDLAGIQPLTYKANRQDNNIAAALGPVANHIRQRIKKQSACAPIPESLLQQVRKAGLSAFYSSRDDYSKFRINAPSIDKYLMRANDSIVIVSLTLSTGIMMDDICAVLQEKIRSNDSFMVDISLLDPADEELYRSLEPVFNAKSDILRSQTNEALRKLSSLKNSLNEKEQERFSVKVHRAIPFGSAIILDGKTENGTIQIETKPYKKAMRQSIAFEIKNSEQNELYEALTSSYYELLYDGREFV